MTSWEMLRADGAAARAHASLPSSPDQMRTPGVEHDSTRRMPAIPRPTGIFPPRSKGRTLRTSVKRLAANTGAGCLQPYRARTRRSAQHESLRRRASPQRRLRAAFGRLVLGETKGHAARDVPLPASLAGDLLQAVHGKPAQTLLFPSTQGRPMRNPNFARRYYEPARQLASASVGRVQAALGVTETRRGLSYFGDATLAALTGFRYDLGLPNPGAIGPETWRALASEVNATDEQRDWLLRSVGIVLEFGDVDLRPPVFHDLRPTAVSRYLSVTKNVKPVQCIAGHKDGTTTINTYGALFDDDFFQAADGLDSLRKMSNNSGKPLVAQRSSLPSLRCRPD